jgi:hypothetical protein
MNSKKTSILLLFSFIATCVMQPDDIATDGKNLIVMGKIEYVTEVSGIKLIAYRTAALAVFGKKSIDECVEDEKKYNVVFHEDDDTIIVLFTRPPPPPEASLPERLDYVRKATTAAPYKCIVDKRTFKVISAFHCGNLIMEKEERHKGILTN